MKFTPYGNLILVKPEAQKEMSSGGIYIPETSQDAISQGLVIEIGEGARDDKGNLIPMWVKRLDKIFFHRYSGVKIKLEDNELIVLRETEILGKVD